MRLDRGDGVSITIQDRKISYTKTITVYDTTVDELLEFIQNSIKNAEKHPRTPDIENKSTTYEDVMKIPGINVPLATLRAANQMTIEKILEFLGYDGIDSNELFERVRNKYGEKITRQAVSKCIIDGKAKRLLDYEKIGNKQARNIRRI